MSVKSRSSFYSNGDLSLFISALASCSCRAVEKKHVAGFCHAQVERDQGT